MIDRYEVEYYLENNFWSESCYDDFGNEISYKDTTDYWREKSYDKYGNRLTYKNSWYD